ncbi:MAG: hypothetical protein MZW92_14320 [Comamonadaceae bacterium]|nr:hypothetical protein [Comamonadaceae bacterium]
MPERRGRRLAAARGRRRPTPRRTGADGLHDGALRRAPGRAAGGRQGQRRVSSPGWPTNWDCRNARCG